MRWEVAKGSLERKGIRFSKIWEILTVVRKNKQSGKTFKYVYVSSVKELLKHIPSAVNSI